jgi:hypothetical protein
MRTRLAIAIALLLGTALAASAGPAPGADNGNIVGTVSVEAAAPCIQLSATALDYGVHPFAQNGTFSQGRADFTVANCGTSESRFLIAGTDAQAGADTWALEDWFDCDGRLNIYGSRLAELPESFSGVHLTKTNQALAHYRAPANNPVQTFLANESETFASLVTLPCVGSKGAGKTFSFSIGLTATVL